MSTMRLTRRGSAYTPAGSTLSSEVQELQNRARRLLENPFRMMTEALTPTAAPTIGWYPDAEISEDDKEFMVSLELPGMKAKDVNLDFNDGLLTIRGEKATERDEKDEALRFHLFERSYGSFMRSFELPNVDAEKVKAEFHDGVLNIHLPKRADATVNARRIPITDKT
jgi:HSP20 family protein